MFIKNTCKKIKEQNNGITLVALVITIIIIIILSTITISTVFGDNGLINTAKKTKGDAENFVNIESGKMDSLLDEYANVMAEDSELPPPDTSKPAEEVLKAGDYVNYVDATGVTRKCVVLYDASSPYGIEIVTMEAVGVVTLGSGDSTVSGTDDFTKAMNSYNNAINTLNNTAMKYNNDNFSIDARCVGSVPDNPNYESGMYMQSGGNYRGQLRDKDDNYVTDWNQMCTLGIQSINNYYWLASRHVISDSDSVYFSVRNMFLELNGADFCHIALDGQVDDYREHTLRLSSSIQVKTWSQSYGRQWNCN